MTKRKKMFYQVDKVSSPNCVCYFESILIVAIPPSPRLPSVAKQKHTNGPKSVCIFPLSLTLSHPLYPASSFKHIDTNDAKHLSFEIFCHLVIYTLRCDKFSNFRLENLQIHARACKTTRARKMFGKCVCLNVYI